MRNASPAISLGKVLWATLLACCLQASLIVVADESANTKSGDDNLQVESDMPKRDWSRNLQMWGKRGWNNLHGGWGLKRSVPSLDQLSYSTPLVEKRAWQSLQGGWGKRYSPSEDDLAIQELASILEQEDNHNIPPIESDSDFEIHNEEKRNWNKFNDGWGKRSKWEKFRGSWGKRDPAWSNLKGIWGKRSVQEQYAN